MGMSIYEAVSADLVFLNFVVSALSNLYLRQLLVLFFIIYHISVLVRSSVSFFSVLDIDIFLIKEGLDFSIN